MYKRNFVFVAACIALLTFGMTLITLGSILPSLQESFGPELSASALVAILPIGILAGSLVFGPIVDRYGYKLLLAASVFISALSMIGLAKSSSITILYACIFLIGLGGGAINGGSSALVADISPDNKGASLSVLSSFYGFGAILTPLLLGQLSPYFHYTTILAGIGAGMLLPVAWFLFVRFPPPKQQQGFPLKEGAKLLTQPALLLGGFFLFFQSGVESLGNNFITTYLQKELGVSNQQALLALSFSVMGLTAGRLLLGSLLKKFSSYKVLLVSMSLVIAGYLVLMNSNSYAISFASVIVIGFGLAGGFPVILGYIGQLYANLSGTAFSIALAIALTGNTIINYLFGRIAERYSVTYLPIQVIICISCMIVLLILLKRKISGHVKF